MARNTPSENLPSTTSPLDLTNKNLQETIDKVMAILAGNEELQNHFNKEFKSMYDSITNDHPKLNLLLDTINNKMIIELDKLHQDFLNDPNLKSDIATKKAKQIITKYTHMELSAFQNSLSKTA